MLDTDPYNIPDQLSDEQLAAMVARLDERGNHERYADWASMTYAPADTGGVLGDKATNVLYARPSLIREIPFLGSQLGSRPSIVVAYVHAEFGRGDYWLTSARNRSVLLVQAGVITQTEAEERVTMLVDASDAGTFFGACNYYAVLMQKRADPIGRE